MSGTGACDRHIQARPGAALQPLGKLGKLEAYAGTAHLAHREVLVGGWNLTLGGLTAEQDRQLGKIIADALGYEP